MTSKQLLLGALLGVLVLALGYAYWASPGQERAVQASRPPSKSTQVQNLSSVEGPTDQQRVRLDILARGVEAFSEPKRDIFRLLQPRPVLPAAPPPMPRITVAPPVALPPIVAPSQSLVSVPRFALLGSLQKEEGRTVFLSLNNDIFVVKEGTRFGNHQEFVADKLTGQQLVVRQEGLPVPIMISLAELRSSAITTSVKRPLVPGQSNPFGTPAFKMSSHNDVAADEGGAADLPEENPTGKAPPAENAGAETPDGSMSSLQLRSIFK